MTVLLTPDGPFYVIRQLCAVLGITGVHTQLQRLQEHAVLGRLVYQFPVQTATRGRQMTWCIHRRGIGYWWGTIQIAKLRTEVRPVVLELQEAIVDAASRLLFGEVSDVIPVGVATINGDVGDIRRFTHALEQRIGTLESVVFGDEGEG
ncbi:MAG: hypothetical protein KGH75_00510 [Rhodospirillales bacterium]|nr:hypothetical protein [Rhodospirillales bacterium]